MTRRPVCTNTDVSGPRVATGLLQGPRQAFSRHHVAPVTATSRPSGRTVEGEADGGWARRTPTPTSRPSTQDVRSSVVLSGSSNTSRRRGVGLLGCRGLPRADRLTRCRGQSSGRVCRGRRTLGFRGVPKGVGADPPCLSKSTFGVPADS